MEKEQNQGENKLSQLVRTAELEIVSQGLSQASPAAAYLATLGTEVSRRSMVTALNNAAKAVTGEREWRLLDWRRLNAAVVDAIMAKIHGAPATRQKTLSAIKGVARAAFRLKELSADDYAQIKDIRGPSGSREVAGRDLKPKEIAALIRVCCEDPGPAGARDAAMLCVAAHTGARRAEISMMGMDDFGEAEDGTTTISVIGKRNKERTLYLHGGALRALDVWLEVRGDAHGAVFCPIDKGHTIHVDRQMSTTALDWILKKRLKQSGIASMSWHDFRRTVTGDLLDAGVDLVTAAGMLGHANVQTTARYDRRGERAKVRASKKIKVPYPDRP